MEHHVGLVIEELDKILYFYRDILGFTIVDNGLREGPEVARSMGLEHAKYRILRAVPPQSEFFIQLIQFQEHQSEKAQSGPLNALGFQHIGLETRSLTAIYQNLQRHGIQTIAPPKTLSSGVSLFYVRDPEGNVLEFFQMPQ